MNQEFTGGTPWHFSRMSGEMAVFERIGHGGKTETLEVPANQFNCFAPLAEWADIIYEENLSLPDNFL